MRTKKRSSPQIRGDMASLHNMVSPQHGNIRGSQPPPPPTHPRDTTVARGPWHFGHFCNIFLPHLSEDQNKFCYLSTGPWHCTIWQIRRWLLHNVHKKFRWGPKIAIFRTKTLHFILVIRLNWLDKIELRGCAGNSGRQYCLLLIAVLRVYCCTQIC